MNEPFTKENAPSITVVIPVFNGMTTLPACLDSLEAQDYPLPLEVIIVDDGSSDGSGDYAESRGIKVIRQENRGPGVARNTGAKEALGEYLVFTDDDCILDGDFISEIVRPLFGTDVIGSQGVLYTKQKSIVARFIQHEYIERYALQSSADYLDWVATYGACYRKDVFLEMGGFNDTYSSEDCELSIRLARKGYKMVFAANAKLRHKHFDNIFKFVRYKYKRAYWTIWLYRKYPNRLVKDKMTPSSRKTMIIYLLLAAVFMFSSIWFRTGLFLGTGFLIIFFAHTVPLSLKIMKVDFLIGLLTPFFLTVRTISYIFGLGKGMIDYQRGIRAVKESAAK